MFVGIFGMIQPWIVLSRVLLVDFAPAGLPNPAAQPLDLAIQREQETSAGRWTNNTLREDYPTVVTRLVQAGAFHSTVFDAGLHGPLARHATGS